MSQDSPPDPSALTRRTVLRATAWSVPVIALATAAPAASASGPITDLSLAATAISLSSIPSGGGSSPLTVTLTNVGGAASVGNAEVFVTRLNPTNGLPASVTDSFTPTAAAGWVVDVTSADHFAFTYTNPIAAGASSSTLTGTWAVAVSPPTLASAVATATIVSGSGGDANTGNNQVSLPFATTNRIALGTAADYVVITGAALTGDAATSVDGAIGFAKGTVPTGFSADAQTHFGGDDANAQAISDTKAAHAQAAALPAGDTLPGQLGGYIVYPGVYHLAGALDLTGVLTFDAKGDSTAQFVLQTDAAVTTAASSSMSLAHGALASNVYWVTTAAVTLGASSLFIGTALVGAAITAGATVTVKGRLLTTSAAVTIPGTAIRLP